MLDQRTAPYAILLLRLALGAFFWAHLYLKFFLYPGGFQQWWDNFALNGYYWFVPWYAVSAEVVGAFLIIPGIYARWASLYALPLMVERGAFHSGAQRFFLCRRRMRIPHRLGDHADGASVGRRWRLCAEAVAIALGVWPQTRGGVARQQIRFGTLQYAEGESGGQLGREGHVWTGGTDVLEVETGI